MHSLIALLRVVGELVAQTLGTGAPTAAVLIAMVGTMAVIAVVVAARLVVPSERDHPVAALSSDLELPVRLSQSDPDAAGHTRSRAPGRAR